MTVLQSPPHPDLRKYIAQYLFLSVDDTCELGNLTQMFFPIDIPGLAFYSKKLRVDHYKNNIHDELLAVYTGMITSPASLSFPPRKAMTCFTVSFKPYGFSYLFNMDIKPATDQLFDFKLMRGREAGLLYQKLMEAKDFLTQVKIADEYFIEKIPENDRSKQLEEVCQQIIRSNGMVDIKTLAKETHQTVSTLERNFSKKVGVLPKEFAKFKRFHKALLLMNMSNNYTLSHIAHSCGYYDQAHFIKDFYAFTNQKPSAFIPSDHPLFYQMILYRNYYK